MKRPKKSARSTVTSKEHRDAHKFFPENTRSFMKRAAFTTHSQTSMRVHETTSIISTTSFAYNVRLITNCPNDEPESFYSARHLTGSGGKVAKHPIWDYGLNIDVNCLFLGLFVDCSARPWNQPLGPWGWTDGKNWLGDLHHTSHVIWIIKW